MGVSLLLSAKHVIDLLAPNGRLLVPRGFDRSLIFETREGLIEPIGVGWLTADAGYGREPRFDIAVMPIAGRPGYTNDVRPLSLDRIARPDAFQPKALFAIAGYPSSPTVTDLDYDARRFRHARFATLAQYTAPAVHAEGLHRLACHTEQVGGPNGLSGSPVLRITFDDNDAVSWGLAGMVIWGGTAELTFIDALHVARLLGATGAKFGWPPGVYEAEPA
jgi:hypothetical protein